MKTLTLDDIDQRAELSADFFVIEPKTAEAIMATRNGLNRPLREAQVAKHVGDIQEGRFPLNGESIIFAPDGQLNDGQHRLTACARSGVPIMSLVAFGLPADTIGTVDQGVSRRAGDVLAFSGVTNAMVVAASARLILSYRMTDGKTLASTTISAPQISEFVRDHPELIDIVVWAEGRRKYARGIITTSLLAAARFILGKQYNPELVVAFLDRVVFGENIARGQPAFATRTRLANLNPKRAAHMLEIVLRGWLSELRGTTLTQVPVHGELPHLIDEARRETSLRVRRQRAA